MNKSFNLKLFPYERMYEDQWYPWSIWVLGWVCILKSLFWIFSSRGFYSETVFPAIMPIKYVISMVILLVLSQGVFNLRIWARNLLLIVCISDLFIHFVFPEFIPSRKEGLGTLILEFGSGPIGDVIIFFFLGLSWKHFGKEKQYLE